MYWPPFVPLNGRWSVHRLSSWCYFSSKSMLSMVHYLILSKNLTNVLGNLVIKLRIDGNDLVVVKVSLNYIIIFSQKTAVLWFWKLMIFYSCLCDTFIHIFIRKLCLVVPYSKPKKLKFGPFLYFLLFVLIPPCH